MIYTEFVIFEASGLSNVFIYDFHPFLVNFWAVCRDIIDLGLPLSTNQLISSLLHDVFSQNPPCWFLFSDVVLTVKKLRDWIKLTLTFFIILLK